ncbi:MAG TPA: hypothetical protein VMY76_03945 [Gemmatimonadales bacterium]|nr:hypothetical protein [Gemmatimonadales bacterium]
MPDPKTEPRTRPPAELFDVLWHLHQEAMRAGSYDAAYHLLAAALHCAERAESLALIGGVESIAAIHQEELDAVEPPEPHSTASAKARGTSPLFTSLRTAARAMAARIRADRVVDDHRARQSAGDTPAPPANPAQDEAPSA